MKNFQILNKLGEGAFSQVYKVKRLTDNQEYALKKVKMMNLSEREKQNALNEIRILASIQHVNVISYKESFIEDSTSSLCIVMEYADGGDLYNKIINFKKRGQTMPEKEVWKYFIQIIKGLQTLHDLKIVHRDIKSANIFLTKDGIIKLGDLNVSKVAKKGLLCTQTGTPYYASPEVWKDKPYDLKSDIWSIGCVLYEMCTTNPPFRANDFQGLSKKILAGIYSPLPSNYSSELSGMVKALLQLNPQQRPTCQQILNMSVTQNHLTETLHRIDSMVEESKEGLLNTIRVPRNLGQITERLPKPQYNSEQGGLKRQSSEPQRIGHVVSNNLRDNLQSAKPGNDYGLKGLVPIREAVEPRSADPARDTGIKNKNPIYYQYRMKNQAKGYQAEKENIRLPQIGGDKSYLQKRGADILAAGNKHHLYQQLQQPVLTRQQNAGLQQAYGRPSYQPPASRQQQYNAPIISKPYPNYY